MLVIVSCISTWAHKYGECDAELSAS